MKGPCLYCILNGDNYTFSQDSVYFLFSTIYKYTHYTTYYKQTLSRQLTLENKVQIRINLFTVQFISKNIPKIRPKKSKWLNDDTRYWEQLLQVISLYSIMTSVLAYTVYVYVKYLEAKLTDLIYIFQKWRSRSPRIQSQSCFAKGQFFATETVTAPQVCKKMC